MNPMIRRLALMLGIVIPGFLMIVMEVNPLIILAVEALVAIAILFLAGSLTAADLKGLRRKAKDQQRAEPVQVPVLTKAPGMKGEGAKVATGSGKPDKKPSRFPGITGVFGNLGIVLRARWHSVRKGKSGIEEIDRALDRAVSPPAAAVALPPLPRAPPGGGVRAASPASTGDPFEDLLNASFEPDLLEDEILGMEVPELEVPGQGILLPGVPRSSVAGKPPEKGTLKEAVPGPGTDGKADSPASLSRKKEEKPGPGLRVKEGEASPPARPVTGTPSPSIPPKPKEIILKDPGESPGKGAGATGISGATPVKVSPPPDELALLQEMKGKGPAGASPQGDPEAAAQEILSFAQGSGGSMDELLASLKADATRVKRTDDSSLLRNMKGTKVQGKELLDDLSSLLKDLT